jgi:hypothetical protein
MGCWCRSLLDFILLNIVYCYTTYNNPAKTLNTVKARGQHHGTRNYQGTYVYCVRSEFEIRINRHWRHGIRKHYWKPAELNDLDNLILIYLIVLFYE